MCPACLTTAALVTAATSAGGMAAVAVKFRRIFSRRVQPVPGTIERGTIERRIERR